MGWNDAYCDNIYSDLKKIENDNFIDKTYDIEFAVWDTSGEIIIDAAAFYQIDNEWFIDDEGLLSL